MNGTHLASAICIAIAIGAGLFALVVARQREPVYDLQAQLLQQQCDPIGAVARLRDKKVLTQADAESIALVYSRRFESGTSTGPILGVLDQGDRWIVRYQVLGYVPSDDRVVIMKSPFRVQGRCGPALRSIEAFWLLHPHNDIWHSSLRHFGPECFSLPPAARKT